MLRSMQSKNTFPLYIFFTRGAKDSNISKGISYKLGHMLDIKNDIHLFICLDGWGKGVSSFLILHPNFSAMLIFLEAPSNITAKISAPFSVSKLIASYIICFKMSPCKLFVKKYAMGTCHGF